MTVYDMESKIETMYTSNCIIATQVVEFATSAAQSATSTYDSSVTVASFVTTVATS